MYNADAMSLPNHAERPLSDLASVHRGSRARLDGAHHDPDRIKRIRALYYGQISHVDDNIGRLMNELENLGMADNTVVLFTTDHGEMLADHGLSQKNCPYEPSVRIPFLFRWPGKTEAGRISEDMVGLTDFLPTLIEELGLEYPEDEHGKLTGESLLGSPGGGLESDRDAYFIDYNNGPGRWIALRTKRYKYALYAAYEGKEELYDLIDDPAEMNNIATERTDLARDFRQRVIAWEKENGLAESFENGNFRTYPRPGVVPKEEECRTVTLNDGPWPKRLPDDEKDSIETFAEAFDRAISKESSLSPEKLSIDLYKAKVLKSGPRDPGGESLLGTKWEDAWNKA